jgi:hypothetical protein
MYMIAYIKCIIISKFLRARGNELEITLKKILNKVFSEKKKNIYERKDELRCSERCAVCYYEPSSNAHPRLYGLKNIGSIYGPPFQTRMRCSEASHY